jgi:phage tail sheath gpL-like
MASDAIGLDRVSRIVGYNLKKGNFLLTSPNLPQRIVILGEANTDNQDDLETEGVEVTSAKQAGELYGYGSPIHMIMRILRPYASDGVGGIPTVVMAQEEADGATAREIEIAVAGTPERNGTHYLKIAGRTGIDGNLYALNITTDDTAATIHQKIEDAVNNVLSSPMEATSSDYEATLTSKWKGLTANSLSVEVDTGDDDLGLTYVVTAELSSGSGQPSISDAITELGGNIWNTIVINGYGTVESIMDSLQELNGIALDENPTGRYGGLTWKPFIAVTGSVAEDPSSSTDSRADEMTIAIAPAPLSDGMQFEAAANMVRLFAVLAQNSPHLDVAGRTYPDMPTPSAIGSMASYTSRDEIVKKGCSTVDLVSGKYTVQDFVTTYHPDGEAVPQYRYCRSLVIDMNVRYGYLLREQIHVVDHVIAADTDSVSVDNVIKPKQWKAELADYATDLSRRALTTDPDFMVDSIEVNIGTSSPDRFETFFRYKRSGYARQVSTTAEAGFNYGTLNN